MVGIPHLQRITYTHGLRPYMDFSTGIVGIKRGISWQSLREELYVEPSNGIKGGSPSKHQVRTAVDGLERIGLLQLMSIDKKLILKCLLAETDITKQNKVGTKLAREVGTPKNGNVVSLIANTEANFSRNDSTPKNTEVGTPKNGEVGTPPSVRDLKSSTSSEKVALQDDDDKNLIFHKNLNAQEIAKMRTMLKSFDSNKAQIMLDELAGHMLAKQIESPVGYFRTIVRDAKNGSFQPERALRVAEGRARQIAIQKQIAESSSASITKKLADQDVKTPKKERPSLTEMLKNSKKHEVVA